MIKISHWRRKLIQKKERAAIPIMTQPGIQMIHKTVKDAVMRGEIHFQAVKALADQFSTAASTMMMDLSVEAEAFGADVRFTDHDIPAVHGRLLTSAVEIRKLAIPELSVGRLPQYLLASELAVKGITDRPVLAGCIGPFSLAGRLFGISEIMLELLSAPETIHRLLEKCTDFLLTYIDAFKKKSVHGIIMAEPAAGMLSPQMCQEFSSTYIKTITDNVQDADFFIILHNCGNTNPLLACIQEAGATGIHLGNKCDIVAALNFLDKDRLVLGNLDPAGLFLMGSGEDVMQATTELLEKTSPYQNFIISSGCDIPPGTPQDNLKAFFTAVSEYNKAAHP